MSQNLYAFLRMLYACEGTAGPNGYRTLYGGGLFDAPPWKHPRQKITAGGYTSTAAGAPQILAGTWDDFVKAMGPRDFDPAGQDECAAWLIGQCKAMADVEAGRLEAAIAKCGTKWASLPGSPYGQPTRSLQFCLERYLAAGGRLGAEQSPAPIEDHSDQGITVGGPDNSNSVTNGAPMPALALLTAFGPILQSLIPQITTLFKPKGEVANRNVELAQTVLDTIVKASGQSNLQGAIEAMQADAAVKTQVQQAVVTQPDIMAVLEVGGGVVKAREFDVQQQASDKPFYKTSAVFWVSMFLLPLVYWYVGSSVVGGIEIPADWPWYAQVPLKMFGLAWSLDARSGMGNLVIGLVLGGICGVYFGISVTQQKQQSGAVTPPPQG